MKEGISLASAPRFSRVFLHRMKCLLHLADKGRQPSARRILIANRSLFTQVFANGLCHLEHIQSGFSKNWLQLFIGYDLPTLLWVLQLMLFDVGPDLLGDLWPGYGTGRPQHLGQLWRGF
jgi:hypothetical protein